jgi:hypothetical protein
MMLETVKIVLLEHQLPQITKKKVSFLQKLLEI